MDDGQFPNVECSMFKLPAPPPRREKDFPYLGSWMFNVERSMFSAPLTREKGTCPHSTLDREMSALIKSLICMSVVSLTSCTIMSPDAYKRCGYLYSHPAEYDKAINSAPIVQQGMTTEQLAEIFQKMQIAEYHLILLTESTGIATYSLSHLDCPIWRYTFTSNHLAKAEYQYFEAGFWTWFNAFAPGNYRLQHMKEKRKMTGTERH